MSMFAFINDVRGTPVKIGDRVYSASIPGVRDLIDCELKDIAANGSIVVEYEDNWTDGSHNPEIKLARVNRTSIIKKF